MAVAMDEKCMVVVGNNASFDGGVCWYYELTI